MSRLIKSQPGNQQPAGQKVISIRMMEMGVKEENEQSLTPAGASQTQFLLEKAAREAEDIIANAGAEAERIRLQIQKEQMEWEQQKAMLSEAARSEGYAQGFQEGQQQGYAEYRETLQLAQDTVDASKRDYRQHIEASEKVILDLGMKVAEKVLGKMVQVDEDFLALVKRALKNARDYKDVQLHIHPIHFQFLLAQKEELIAIFPKEVDFYIYPDDDLPEQACIIESENGRIDAGVDSQLKEIKLRLSELLEGEEQ